MKALKSFVILSCWRRLWRVFKDIQTQEPRRPTIDQKFREMCFLYAAGKAFGWTEAPEVEDPRARGPWIKLRAAYVSRSEAIQDPSGLEDRNRASDRAT